MTARQTKISQKAEANAARKGKAKQDANEPTTPPTTTGTLGDNASNQVDPNYDPLADFEPPTQADPAPVLTHPSATDAPMPTSTPMPQLGVQPGGKTKEMVIVLVGIKRGLEEIPTQVMRHEIPLLRAIHLPENVRIIDPEFSAVDVPDSIGAEWARLRNKYNQDLDKLDRILRGPDDLADRLGLKDDTLEFGEVPQAVVEENRRKPSANAK